MKNVMIVGAGRLGKGFVGETFHNAGWNISFLDKDPKVISELNKNGKYQVKVHTTDDVFINEIDNFQAFLTEYTPELTENFLNTDLLMCPLYPEDFEESAKFLSVLFKKQYEVKPEDKKTIICLTNKNHIISNITNYFKDNLENDELREWFDKNVVIRDSIVRRSTDAKSNYSTDLVTTAVASLIIQGPVNSDFSDVQWLDVRENVEMLKDIKVFTINGPHAATAYMGYLKKYDDIVTAQEDSEVANLIKAVHDATVQAVLYEYPVTREDIRELEYLPKAKNEMPDAIFRVAFDPIRKVGPQDRFMGVIALCQKYDINFDGIAKALACAFHYAEPKDPSAVKLNKEIKANGLQETVAKYIGRSVDDVVVNKILLESEKLKQAGVI
ncbi:mannitol-1-phosphate 5-dehydrogenase [Vagococcus fluvialis]|uniref:Mannitol dehydrogenase n=1 Tax=Vagococcus fluvialis TaxID=2738 RepID=A0A369AQ76_9ENTE|nr:mannitol dehydrogenase [Vagococcus fluvialis]RCX10386.1 mannitol-1-phosphate 5-dehydrogenase [Vagococcus fluvialis]RST98656.1 mannitol dehydrogenase [Vagococcus fluvialis]